MLRPSRLRSVFQVYFDDMDRCERGRAYWSLLHVAICLPDVCGALGSTNGEANGSKYRTWCDTNLPPLPGLTSSELYSIRCKVLHQGRSGHRGRYSGFSFGSGAPGGEVDHMRVSRGVLHIDVSLLAWRLRHGVEGWIVKIERAPLTLPEASNVAKHLPSLVQVQAVVVPSNVLQGAFVTMTKTQ